MNVNDFTWREHRTSTLMCSQIPLFSNTGTTKIPSYRHHTSMYAINEEDAHLQRRLGNTKNRVVQHYSSELVIDTDNHQTAENIWAELFRNDYYFELWKLNNYKFILQRDESDKPSTEMVYQDKQFVKDSFLKCSVGRDGLDTSIYSSPFHLIRAKNSIHEITGAKSKLVEVHKGSNLVKTNDIELKTYEKTVYSADVNLSDWGQFKYIIELAQGKSCNNHMNIWQLSKDLSKFLSEDSALEVALIYSKSLNYCEMKTQRAFKQAFAEGRQ